MFQIDNVLEKKINSIKRIYYLCTENGVYGGVNTTPECYIFKKINNKENESQFYYINAEDYINIKNQEFDINKLETAFCPFKQQNIVESYSCKLNISDLILVSTYVDVNNSNRIVLNNCLIDNQKLVGTDAIRLIAINICNPTIPEKLQLRTMIIEAKEVISYLKNNKINEIFVTWTLDENNNVVTKIEAKNILIFNVNNNLSYPNWQKVFISKENKLCLPDIVIPKNVNKNNLIHSKFIFYNNKCYLFELNANNKFINYYIINENYNGNINFVINAKYLYEALQLNNFWDYFDVYYDLKNYTEEEGLQNCLYFNNSQYDILISPINVGNIEEFINKYIK